MKKKFLVVSTMMLMFSLLTACSSKDTNNQTDSSASTNIEDINSSEPVETTTSSQQSEEAMSTNELSDSEEPAVLDIGAEDASIYNSEDNAVPRISLDASPIGSKTFNTDDGMVYIGLGVSYGIDHNSSDAAHPGDTISLKSVFSTLKNYDESEYLFKMNWYEGEIETENRRELYFSAQ